MQTYTHLILTHFLGRQIETQRVRFTTATGNKEARIPPWSSGAALAGAVAPDMPLIALFLTFLTLDLMSGKTEKERDKDAHTLVDEATATSRVDHLFGSLFFKDWRVVLFHNLFHAPLLTLAYTWLGYRTWKQKKAWGADLFWFGVSCTLHTAIDIPLHHDDGPLLFFPFNWRIRYRSPVSYWDTRRYGKQFRIIEHALCLVVGFWIIRNWWNEVGRS